jgi:hypothetical protein
MTVFRAFHLLLVPLVAGLASEAQAQGKGKGDKHGNAVVIQQGHGKGHEGKRHEGKKVVTTDHAVDVTRVVLREQGYELVRVEQRRDVRIVYYRRGNMGRGRGKGPIMRMVIRPSADYVVIEQAPQPLLVQINVRLGR